MIKRIAMAIVAATLAVMAGATPVRAADPAVWRILVLGDSISQDCGHTPPGGWCAELDAQLTMAGVPHVIMARALGGAQCSYNSTVINTTLQQYAPDLVLLYCGTNNDGGTAAGRTAMGEQWRTIVEATHVYGARIAVARLGYSNPEVSQQAGRSWMVPNEQLINDQINSDIQYYLAPGWFTGIVDLRIVPGTPDYLANFNDAGGLDGIHPSAYGARVIGQLWYDALAAGTVPGTGTGWPRHPLPAGLWGHDGRLPVASWPTYTIRTAL